jgi:spore coat protein CotH
MKLINNKKRLGALAIVVIFLVTAIVFKLNITDNANTNTKNITKTLSGNTTEYDSIFEKDSVIDIKINLSEDDWNSMLDDPEAEEYKSASVTVDGNTVENVGVRTKGNLTLRSVVNSDSDRYSFRIKVDKYVDGQTLLGLDEFVVNNMYSDPSFLREYLSYEALKSVGATVPKTVFANIYINDKLFGFYLCVEALDDSYLKTNFGDNDGNLYKQEQGSSLQYVENSNYEKSEQKNGKDESKTDLKNFIKTLNEMPDGAKGDIENVLDVDSALMYIAANTALGNYDSYSGNMIQNYYLYSQNNKFTVLPWDYNMSFAGFGMGGGDATTIPIDEPVMGVNIDSLPLIKNLLEVPEYKEKYHQYVSDFVNYLENFETRVTELANIIRPYVEADPTKFYTMEQFEASIKYNENSTSASNPQITNNGNMSTEGFNGPVDAVTAASENKGVNAQVERPQNANGQFENRQQQPPKDQQGARPGGFPNENQQGRPEGGMGGDMKAGGNGGPGMMGNSTSIVNYVRARVENIRKQLSGELPTTGNTTMNSNGMRGGNRTNK